MNTMTVMNPGHAKLETSLTPALLRVARYSTAAALGCALASTASLHSGPQGFTFQWSIATFVTFVIGAAAALLYWKLEAGSTAQARWGRILLTIIGIGLFLYPLRFVPAAKLPEIATGLAAAVCALSLVAVMLLLVRRFLDSED